MLKRTPLARKTQLQAKTPIRQISKKRAVQNRQRAKVVAALKAQYPFCQARCVRECTNTPDDAHEVLTRARGGSITDSENMMIVCRRCHSWITDNPLEAANRGFVVHSWDA